MGYENITKGRKKIGFLKCCLIEQRAQLNGEFNAKDMIRLDAFPCTQRIKTNNIKELRCQVGEVGKFIHIE